MAEQQWFYSQRDQMLGPVPGGELRRLAQSGQLLPTDLIWREGMPEWAPAARIKGLFPGNAVAASTDAKPVAANAVAVQPKVEEASVGLMTQATATSVDAAFVEPVDLLRAAGADSPAEAQWSPEATVYPPDQSPHDVELAEVPPRESPAALARPALQPAGERRVELADSSESSAIGIKALAVFDVLWWAQVALWGLCILTVFVGGLLFLVACVRANRPGAEVAAAAVYGMFALASYVLARAGERMAALLLAYYQRK